MEKRLSVTITLDDNLHRAWRAEALLQGISMRDAVVAALELWIVSGVEKRRGARRRHRSNEETTT